MSGEYRPIEGFPVGGMTDLNAFPEYPLCSFCADKGITFDDFNGFRFCGCPAGQLRALAEPQACGEANEARVKTGAKWPGHTT